MFVTLKKMPYAQAKVQIVESGANLRCNLISYSTCVAHIIDGGWVLVNGLYSATTRKHLGAFAAEYCGTSYQTLQRCYEENLAYNIYDKVFMNRTTGEVLS